MVQEERADIRLVLIGAGAIGCALLPRLLRMPLSVITVVDGDRVEARNIDRQDLYAEVDIGRSKAEVAAAWSRNAPVSVEVTPVDGFLDPGNAASIIAMHDIAADCTDDLHARDLIDRACNDHGVALVSGAVHARQGQVLVLHASGEGEHLSRRALFSGRTSVDQDGCDMRDVPAAVIDEVARRMAWRVREVINGAAVQNGRIEQYDGDVRAWIEFAPPRIH